MAVRRLQAARVRRAVRLRRLQLPPPLHLRPRRGDDHPPAPPGQVLHVHAPRPCAGANTAVLRRVRRDRGAGGARLPLRLRQPRPAPVLRRAGPEPANRRRRRTPPPQSVVVGALALRLLRRAERLLGLPLRVRERHAERVVPEEDGRARVGARVPPAAGRQRRRRRGVVGGPAAGGRVGGSGSSRSGAENHHHQG
uniref:Uncharacterized protein n=1 Tax=Oryza rufipogon TaxID=4529 RepID=A0A0E0QQH1_ORYRU